MKAVIIDDEKKARNVLRTMLLENCAKITQIFEAENLVSGVSLIKSENPSLIFLDIEMPENSGLEILNHINKEDYNFEIIFVTAYSDYAIQAFQLSAIDYLLKPIRPTQLNEAVEKAISQIGKSQISLKLEELKNSLQSNNFKKIGIPYADGIKFVNFEDIIMFEADGMYTKVSIKNMDAILVSKPLRFFVDLFTTATTFYKPHRSFLINLMFIKEYIKKDGGYILMENDKTVSISKDKKEEFLTIVQNI
ncbi:MAG: LytTR family DNA-binding domain-containing protein [Polaribacter sp.]|uniref:LytR/AlgR family response regulator transcription factor n=1 Tax=Polaribacter sp. TaxID=1920175 RepID=UPI003BAE1E84